VGSKRVSSRETAEQTQSAQKLDLSEYFGAKKGPEAELADGEPLQRATSCASQRNIPTVSSCSPPSFLFSFF